MKPVPFLISALVGVVLASCKPTPPPAANTVSAPTVKLVSPFQGEIWRNITLPASVAANQQAVLCAKVTGYLKAIHVDKGTRVEAGQLLAEIEAPELLAEVAKAKADSELAALEFQRATAAHQKAPDLVISQQLDTARSKSLIAKASLERAETLLGFCRITAPFSGVVTSRSLDPGAFVPAATAANAQGAALLTLADFQTVRIQVAVPELEVSFISNGLPVRISLEGLPGKTFEGGITRFSQSLDERTKTMLVEIDLPNFNGALRPGMFATAKLGLEKRSQVSLIPTDAVLVEKAGSSVFTVSEGKAKKVAVKTGFNDGVNVEILEGLPAGTPVVLLGKLALLNGQPVNVLP